MMQFPRQPVYYVVFFVIGNTTMEQVKAEAPDALAEHLKRSQVLQAQGIILMAGAFLDNAGESLTTMGVFPSREAAEEYAAGDPFVLNGMVTQWYIREWANILA
jgi:uncharacterized protein